MIKRKELISLDMCRLQLQESVMLKIVYEESASVTSFCAIVDTCLSLGLKRRALGLFKTR